MHLLGRRVPPMLPMTYHPDPLLSPVSGSTGERTTHQPPERRTGMNRITWTTDRYYTMRGTVGELDLFTIDMTTIRSGPQYFLRTRLEFEVAGMDMHGDDPEALKDAAERLLAAYVAALGAAFPDA